jgi:4-amino-4-deoxy-L-arabinose transferase-like glycosyltransferase
MNKKFIITWITCSLLFGLIINSINLKYIKKYNSKNSPLSSKSSCYGYTVYSIDNVWYLPQIKNYLKGKGFTYNSTDIRNNVRRTPVYPMFYGLHYILFGEKASFLIIRYVQLVLFSISTILLGLSILNITSNIKWAKYTTILYALNPFVVIYCYYTLTESLFPFLEILCFFFFSKSIKNRKYLMLCGLSLGLLVLTRPICIILGLCLGLSLIIYNQKTKESLFNLLKYLSMLTVPFLLVLSVWGMRNYLITKEIVFLEKYYEGATCEEGQGAVFMTEWAGCWSNPTDIIGGYHHIAFTFISNPIKLDSFVNNYMNKLPSYAFCGSSYNEVKDAFITYNSCLVEREKLKNQTSNSSIYFIEHNLKCNESVKIKFSNLTSNFKKKAPFRYYIITPLLTIKDIIFQSFSSAYACLNPDDRHFSKIQFIFKSIMYILNVFLFLSFIFYLKTKTDFILKFFIISIVVLTTVFLSFIYRRIESRYMLQVYPFLYITLSFLFYDIKRRWLIFKLNKD